MSIRICLWAAFSIHTYQLLAMTWHSEISMGNIVGANLMITHVIKYTAYNNQNDLLTYRCYKSNGQYYVDWERVLTLPNFFLTSVFAFHCGEQLNCYSKGHLHWWPIVLPSRLFWAYKVVHTAAQVLQKYCTSMESISSLVLFLLEL